MLGHERSLLDQADRSVLVRVPIHRRAWTHRLDFSADGTQEEDQLIAERGNASRGKDTGDYARLAQPHASDLCTATLASGLRCARVLPLSAAKADRAGAERRIEGLLHISVRVSKVICG